MEKIPTTTEDSTDKPKRLYFKTYLQLIKNSIGSEMFRNFYIQDAAGRQVDALSDGSDSCAFYVSSVLLLFGKQSGIHGTTASTVKDLDESGWERLDNQDAEAGDVVFWEAVEMEGEWYDHIGFSIGDGRAVSTSWTEKKIVEHDLAFDGARDVSQVFRHHGWD